MTRVEVSPLLVFFAFRIIAVGLNVVSAHVRGHPRIDEPPGTNSAGSGARYFRFKERELLAEVHDLDVHAVEDGDEDIQHDAAQEDNQATLERKERDHVNLVIAVPSVRPDRREAIRKTWFKWGDDRVVLRFFTEPPNEANDEKQQELSAMLANESLTHGDIIVQDIATGLNFGVRLLEAMWWMSSHYSFDFFLRLDDDYFLCLGRLLKELSCLLESGTPQKPFYAGSLACGEAPYIDEAYILVPSLVVDRVVAASDLNCTATGSLTSAAWVSIGGPANLQGDVAWVRDLRLDYMGGWWNKNHTSLLCEEKMGVHHTFPNEMKKYWEYNYSKMKMSQSTADGCEDIFRYEDDETCPTTSVGVDDELLVERLMRDNLQPCDSFKTYGSKMWCGKQGC